MEIENRIKKIRRMIEICETLKKEDGLKSDWCFDSMIEAFEIAIEALQEKAERG